MPSVTIVRDSKIVRTPRVAQLEGIFDVAPSKRSTEEWTIDLELPNNWNIGLIVGPSGSGKTTIARELFGNYIVSNWDWPENKSIVDGFPDDMSIKEITMLLSSVGFSSPPSWVRPFNVLSNGEQFRVHIARTLAEQKELSVVDEFTSVVDRTVAKIGSAAIAKTVRRRKQQFIAISCHYDIAEWLEPDWVYQPHTGEFFTGRYLRPSIELEIKRVHRSAWRLFRKHHYLDTNLHTAAQCFCAFWNDEPVAFSAYLHFPHPRAKNIKREHRTVCLPDFQGVGIGNALSDFIGGYLKAQGFRFQSQTSNPAIIHSRNKSKNWAMIQAPTRKTKAMPKKTGLGLDQARGAYEKAKRLRASFEYIGPKCDHTGIEPVLIK